MDPRRIASATLLTAVSPFFSAAVPPDGTAVQAGEQPAAGAGGAGPAAPAGQGSGGEVQAQELHPH